MAVRLVQTSVDCACNKAALKPCLTYYTDLSAIKTACNCIECQAYSTLQAWADPVL
jgi:hypothetical protein